jgi:hypothetical protein
MGFLWDLWIYIGIKWNKLINLGFIWDLYDLYRNKLETFYRIYIRFILVLYGFMDLYRNKIE